MFRSLLLLMLAPLAALPAAAQTDDADTQTGWGHPAPVARLGLANGLQETTPLPGVAVRAPPRGNPALWITPGDYPKSALRAEEEGQVLLLLRIGADGRVMDCTVGLSSNSTALDAQSCQIVTERARFAPATRRNGKPVPDRAFYSYDWKIPADQVRPPPLAEQPVGDPALNYTQVETLPTPTPRNDPDGWILPADYPPGLVKTGGSVTVALTVAPSGLTTGCTISASSGSPAWDKQICSILRRRARFHPGLDATGKPVESGWEHRYSWAPAIAQ